MLSSFRLPNNLPTVCSILPGNFPALDPVVRAALAERAARGATGSKGINRFDQDAYYRLASLLNVALCDTLRAWIVENIQVWQQLHAKRTPVRQVSPATWTKTSMTSVFRRFMS
jgi:hypothetical protein